MLNQASITFAIDDGYISKGVLVGSFALQHQMEDNIYNVQILFQQLGIIEELLLSFGVGNIKDN